jgi:iron complex transport system ATP-binding protein
MIELTNISYRIGSRMILQDVDFSVAPGEVLAILGSNGAGKSTLLKIARGELKPLTGGIAVRNRPLSSWPQRELAQFTAVLQQQTILTLPFTVQEVVMMGRYPHFKNNPGPEDIEIVNAALKKADIEKLAKRNFLQLSGGEQQRVQLARVFAQIWHTPDQKTRYLLMDEPGNNLDISHQHNALGMARDFAAAGNCVVAILHDLNLAFQYADKVLLLHHGSAIAYGPPSEVLNAENISQAYDFPMTMHYHESLEHPVILHAGKNGMAAQIN